MGAPAPHRCRRPARPLRRSATEGTAETRLWSLDFSSPTVLVMGAEEKGLRPAVRKACDILFRIPMAPGAQSLNVSVAAGIALARAYEFRQL